MKDLPQPILNGILLGGLYAIIAIGLSTIMGIVKVMNFAHGDMMILSSYLCLFCVLTWLGLQLLSGASSSLSPVDVPHRLFFSAEPAESGPGQGDGPSPDRGLWRGDHLAERPASPLHPGCASLDDRLGLKTILSTSDLRIPVNYLLDFLIGLAVIFFLYIFFQKSYLGTGDPGGFR